MQKLKQRLRDVGMFVIIIVTMFSSHQESFNNVVNGFEIRCKCHSPKEWEQLSATPMAWLVLTHSIITMERSIRLLHKIWRPHHTYVIHVDKSVPRSDFMWFVDKINEKFLIHDNIFVISEMKGGYRAELVEIELVMLRTILRPRLISQKNYHGVPTDISENKSSDASYKTCKTREWEYAAILSGDSYPLQDIDVIVRRISSQYAFLNPLGMVYMDGQEKYYRFVKFKRGKVILEKLAFAYQKCGDNKKANKLNAFAAAIRTDGTLDKKTAKIEAVGAPIYKGLQWIVLTRNFAEYSVNSELAHRLLKAFKHIALAGDEHYFQNLLYASCRDDLINEIASNHSDENMLEFMHTTWTKGQHSDTILPDEVQKIHRDVMFARKIRTLDTEDVIERRILNTRNHENRNHEKDYMYYCCSKWANGKEKK